ncbi:hypothetical protein VTK73DRAFT_4719 [Phialemonium thermophilum]|uniref:Uncharacterized protein n=1 Tax=Phialemonium thermophilum TaxID=223376 RepID=A0ABR3V6K3_9PEZI
MDRLDAAAAAAAAAAGRDTGSRLSRASEARHCLVAAIVAYPCRSSKRRRALPPGSAGGRQSRCWFRHAVALLLPSRPATGSPKIWERPSVGASETRLPLVGVILSEGEPSLAFYLTLHFPRFFVSVRYVITCVDPMHRRREYSVLLVFLARQESNGRREVVLWLSHDRYRHTSIPACKETRLLHYW